MASPRSARRSAKAGLGAPPEIRTSPGPPRRLPQPPAAGRRGSTRKPPPPGPNSCAPPARFPPAGRRPAPPRPAERAAHRKSREAGLPGERAAGRVSQRVTATPRAQHQRCDGPPTAAIRTRREPNAASERRERSDTISMPAASRAVRIGLRTTISPPRRPRSRRGEMRALSPPRSI